MKIYVASSWRNTFQPEVVQALREDGYTVYDFKGSGDGWGSDGKGPGGFGWHEIDKEWEREWKIDIPRYLKALDHPRAVEGFLRDMDALRACDVCVMVMPCGPSASMEMGWACGAGRPVVVYIPGLREPDLMVKMAHMITDSLQETREFCIDVATGHAWEIAGQDTGTPAGRTPSGAGLIAAERERQMSVEGWTPEHDDDLDYDDYEPECTCQRVDVDLYDNRWCEAHNPDSQWNIERRRRERQVKPAHHVRAETQRMEIASDDTPF